MLVTLALVLALVSAVSLIAGLGPGLLEVAKVVADVLALAAVTGLGVAEVFAIVLAFVAGLVPGLVENAGVGFWGSLALLSLQAWQGRQVLPLLSTALSIPGN